MERVRRHLDGCVACRAYLADVEEHARLLAALPRLRPQGPALSSCRAAFAAWEERSDENLAREEQTLRPVLDLERLTAPPGLRARVLARILRPSPRLRLVGGATAAAAAAAILAAFLWTAGGPSRVPAPQHLGRPIAESVDVQVHAAGDAAPTGPERRVLARLLGTSAPALFEERAR